MLEAITRAETENLSGSHVAGIFGKAANRFEKEVRSFTFGVLKTCSLDYDLDLRSAIRLPASKAKLTLGNVIAIIEESSKQRKSCIAANVPGGWKVLGFIDALKKINDAWVEVKHGDDVPRADLVARMKSMLTVWQLIRTRSS